MKRPGVLSVAAACLLMSACAHSRLRLELDVYRGDPAREIPLNPDQLVALRREIRNGLNSVDPDLARQHAMAHDLLDVYVEFACLHAVIVTGACDRADLKEVNDLLPGHLATLDQRAARVKALLLSADTSVVTYERLLSRATVPVDTMPAHPMTERVPARSDVENPTARLALQAAALRSGVTEAAESLRAFSRPPDTDFQHSLAEQWGDIGAAFDRNPQLADASATPAFTTQINVLRQRVVALASRLKAANPDLAATLLKAADATTDPRELTRSLTIIGKAVNSLPPGISASTPPALGLSRIVGNRELYDSQIDRLKDPADPVWRIVSAPENEWRWNQRFIRTWFYAEGKSDVIVVRDGPLDYRVQSASNNPSVLVESQLQISRAVTNAAITALGSASGVKLGQGGAKEPGTTPENVDDTAVETMARRNARVAEVQRLRAATNRTIQTQLRSIASELSAAPAQARQSQLLDRLQGLLKGYKEFLTAIGPEVSDAKTNKTP